MYVIIIVTIIIMVGCIIICMLACHVPLYYLAQGDASVELVAEE